MLATKNWFTSLALLLPLLFCGVAAAQNGPAGGKTFVMKLATATLNDGQHEWMRQYAAAIEGKSGGRVKAELYPAGQLGSIPRMIEGTQLGSIQMFLAPPEFFVGVGRTLGDLKGRKIRVLASPFQIDQIAKLGGTGVPLSLGDVLPALQQGTIDGALGNLGVFTALGYYDTAKHMNETGHSFNIIMAAMSKRWFDTLPPYLQTIVLATAQEVGAGINPWVLDFLVRQRKIWVEKGGELESLSSADKAEMMAKVGPVAEDIVKTRPELKPMWELLRAAAKRSRDRRDVRRRTT
jgi:TRAP-type C4-dicarboxylate transport system substrate-binding protein